MENQKVRDLSTAQNPKATDFVMLITNLTNNVLEKCQISALRDLMTTNNISDEEENALTLGSDDKLYVPDLTENIGIVASNLNDLSDDVNTVTNNLDTLTGQVGQIQTEVDNVSNYLLPNYSGAINISLPYTASQNGWVFAGTDAIDWQHLVYVNGQPVSGGSGSAYGGKLVYDGGLFPVSMGDVVTATTPYGPFKFYPMKGAN